MGNVLIYLMAITITMPIILTATVYFLSYKITNHKRKAFHLAVNWTTLFYILSTIHLLFIILGHYFIAIILGVILSILILVIVYQWRYKTEILIFQAIKLSWRIYFLLFFILYVLLILIGILQRITFY